MARRGRNPGDAFERRRGDVERVQNAGSQNFKIGGEVTILNPGEASHSVNFPVLFVDKPFFTFGVEVERQATVLGNMPTCSVVVIAWHERVRDDGTIIYTGAQFAIVSTGPTDQVLRVQWQMEGIGLRGPVEEED